MSKAVKNTSHSEKIQKSLNTAAKLLNRSFHSQSSGKVLSAEIKNMNTNLFRVTLFQAFCRTDNEPVGEPTTSKTNARTVAKLHFQQTGHITDVIDSE